MSKRKWSDDAQRMRDDKMMIVRLEGMIRQLEHERSQYRTHAALRVKWWIELHGKGQSPNLAWLIENDVKFLQTVTSFVW